MGILSGFSSGFYDAPAGPPRSSLPCQSATCRCRKSCFRFKVRVEHEDRGHTCLCRKSCFFGIRLGLSARIEKQLGALESGGVKAYGIRAKEAEVFEGPKSLRTYTLKI